MNTPRFYCPQPLAPGARFELPPEVARHAVRVLRLPPGAELTLFDGRGGEYPATLERVDKDHASVHIGPWRDIERESPLQLTLLQAVQAADKMDFTVQKAVELGVAAIVPLTSRRSVVRLDGERAVKRVAHWQGIAAAACEQCGRNRIPMVAPLEPLLHGLSRPAVPGRLRLMLAPGAARHLADLPAGQDIELLIGAEGGLDPEEITAAAQCGFVPVKLGPRILRTETAGLAALAALQALRGDWGG
ncbi:MAG: hypothetical protein RIR00_1790 [Pseudomonadota bacterium]|jgi:16S rRNA (uracil1498-N3)-methyltransferase